MRANKINSKIIREKADCLRKIVLSMKDFTENMTNEIERFHGQWREENPEIIIEEFIRLSITFEDKFTTLNEYSEFLNIAADEWDRVNTENI